VADKKPRILVSNDDGYFSEGLRALVDAVSPLGEVWVVAPDREQSATSHSISLNRPLPSPRSVSTGSPWMAPRRTALIWRSITS